MPLLQQAETEQLSAPGKEEVYQNRTLSVRIRTPRIGEK